MLRGVRELTGRDLKKIVGHFTGQNIFRVDLNAAVRRARANPWIKEVRIHRSLPNRIAMNVVERVPLAVLETGQGIYLMDHEPSSSTGREGAGPSAARHRDPGLPGPAGRTGDGGEHQ